MRSPAHLLPVLLVSLLATACADPVRSPPRTSPDAGNELLDGGGQVDAGDGDAGVDMDAGLYPDAGGDLDAGEASDAGEGFDAGDEDGGLAVDAGQEPDAGSGCLTTADCPGGTCVLGQCVPCDGLVCGGSCVDDQTDENHCGACGEACGAQEICTGGECGCPAFGCEDLPECASDGMAATGCGTCLNACTKVHEREELEVIADAFRTFRKDTGGWPYFETDWSVDDEKDEILGGVDPARFETSDVALFSRGAYTSCEGLVGPQSCWQGPYLQPGSSLASEPWLDAWGRVRMFAIIPPKELLAGSVSSAPDGAVIIWSKGPDGIDQTGCTTPSPNAPLCAADKKKIAVGEASVQPSDDIIVFVGSSL